MPSDDTECLDIILSLNQKINIHCHYQEKEESTKIYKFIG